MNDNYLKKRTPQERLIIAKTLLETVLDDMPFVEKAQLSEEGTTFDIPSAEPKTPSNGSITCVKSEKMHDRTTDDLISRQEAIRLAEQGQIQGFEWQFKKLCTLPSAEPERLTDDDFETIRIHLNAQKEKLCNQQRWEEAEEYQRIIDRFMAFASAQPDLQPTCNNLATDTISKKEATTIPVMPKEHREYQTMNLDDAYEQGWFDYQKCIEELPSAEPEPKPISYMECANAMLKMWIDYVLTDGEYNRIMDKLNSKHMADIRGEQE